MRCCLLFAPKNARKNSTHDGLSGPRQNVFAFRKPVNLPKISPMSHQPNESMLSAEEVAKIVAFVPEACAARSLTRFGPPVKTGECSRWFLSDVTDYLGKLKAARTQAQRRSA